MQDFDNKLIVGRSHGCSILQVLELQRRVQGTQFASHLQVRLLVLRFTELK